MPSERAARLTVAQTGFLDELDKLLAGPLELHYLGGFVINACYDFPRPTADVDYVSVRPESETAQLQSLAGEGSKLSQKYGLHIHRVTVVTLPNDYESRLVEMFPLRFKNLRILALEPYDLALSKLERNSPKDREDVAYLAKSVPLEPEVLQRRYREELRPYVLAHEERHDLTLRLWLESYFPAT